MSNMENITIRILSEDARRPEQYRTRFHKLYASKVIELQPKCIHRVPIDVHISAKRGTGIVYYPTKRLEQCKIDCAGYWNPEDPSKEMVLILFNSNKHRVLVDKHDHIGFISLSDHELPISGPSI